FRRAAHPNNDVRVATKEVREFLASFLERNVSAVANAMRTRRIAGNIFRRRQPCLARLTHHWRGRVMVEVNHERDSIQFAAKLASFLCAAVKANESNSEGNSHFPSNRLEFFCACA